MSVIARYDAPLDKMTKTITTIVLILALVSISIGIYAIYKEVSHYRAFFSLLIVLIGFSLFVLPYLFSPLEFMITTSGIVIKRLLRNINLPFSDIISMKRISKDIVITARLWGSGGLYGFIGLFYVKDLGKTWMYVTSRDKMVLIETIRGKKFIISPSDPDSFVEKAKQFLRSK